METLADRIARDGPIKELDAVGWAIRLAKRLEALHSLGVAHGSVSPACIVTSGVERTARAHLADVQHTTSIPSFHSPERIMGGDISTADDAWAVAVTLYTALTGTNPFGAPRDTELRHRILAASPTPLAVFDVGDDDLQHILDRAFAREINRRSTSVTALRQALEEWHPDPGVGELPPLDDEDGDDDGEDDNVRTVMRTSPFAFPVKSSPKAPPVTPAAEDDDEDDDDARTMMREPGMGLGPPSPAVPPVGPGSPFGNPSAGFRPLGSGRNLAPARPAAGRPADGPQPPSSGRMPPPRMPPPVAVAPAAHEDDDDDDDDVRTRMRSPTINDEDSSDVRTKMRDPGVWPPVIGAGRPAPPPPAAGAPPPGLERSSPMDGAPGGVGGWGTPEDPGPVKTMAFPGGFDLGPPPEPPQEPERSGPGLNLFAAQRGPQLGPRAPMESGSYGRPPPEAFAPPQQAPMPPMQQAPQQLAPANPYGVPPAQMAAFPGPPGMPGASASSGNAGRRGLIIVAVLALFVAAALTFIFLRYRAVLLPG